MDYAALTKRGVLAGVALFLFGLVGELLIHTIDVGAAGTLDVALFSMEAAGILIAVLSVLVFGIALPLVE